MENVHILAVVLTSFWVLSSEESYKFYTVILIQTIHAHCVPQNIIKSGKNKIGGIEASSVWLFFPPVQSSYIKLEH